MNRATIVKELVRIARLLSARGAVKVDVHSDFLLVTTGIPLGANDLKSYQRELAVAESIVNGKAMMLVKQLKKNGHRAKTLNAGLTPEEGVLGIGISVLDDLTPDEMSEIHRAQ